MKTRLFTQITILLSICLLGEIIAQILPIPFPASVISMIILLIMLISGIIKMHNISDIGDFLLNNMGFFFIPISVSIMEYVDTLRPIIIPFLIICTVSTFITFATSFFAVRITTLLMNKFSKNKLDKEEIK